MQWLEGMAQDPDGYPTNQGKPDPDFCKPVPVEGKQLIGSGINSKGKPLV
jgi:hypothetical protein